MNEHIIEVENTEQSPINKNAMTKDMLSYDRNNLMNQYSKMISSFRRGAELENHIVDIYSDQLQKQKQELEYKLYLDLDLTKKKQFKEFQKNVQEIELDMTDKVNNMIKNFSKLTSKNIEDFLEECDEERKTILKHKNNATRYKKLSEKIDEIENSGIDTIYERLDLLLDKQKKLFNKAIELFKEKM